jgi:putative two-component system response regulator
VDIYDALTHPRPYKHAYTSAHALEILQEETGRGWRDPEISSLFIRVHEQMLAKVAERYDGDAALGEIGDSLRNLQTHLTQ